MNDSREANKTLVRNFVEVVKNQRKLDRLGEFLNIPATGKKATWTEIQFFRIKDGKVVEHWVDVDIFSWFQQIGVIPQMG